MKCNKIIKLITLAICATSNIFAMDPKKTQMNNLKIMTFNIRRKGKEDVENRLWDNRKQAVFAMLQTQKPAILGLQEATKDQIVDLKTALKGYNAFGKGRGTSWGGRGTDESSPIFYDARKVTKQSGGTFVLNPEFKQTGIMNWGRYILGGYKNVGLLPRVCTYALFKDKKTNKRFYVFNTHLDHKYEQARVKQIQTILNKIKELVKGKIPVILMGDFNANITGEVAKLLKDDGFVNTTQKPTITQRGWSGKETKIIDHILIKNGQAIQIINHKVLVPNKGTIWSDHYPVMVDLKF